MLLIFFFFFFEPCGKDSSRVRHAGDGISSLFNPPKLFPAEHHLISAEQPNPGIQDQGEINLFK